MSNYDFDSEESPEESVRRPSRAEQAGSNFAQRQGEKAADRLINKSADKTKPQRNVKNSSTRGKAKPAEKSGGKTKPGSTPNKDSLNKAGSGAQKAAKAPKPAAANAAAKSAGQAGKSAVAGGKQLAGKAKGGAVGAVSAVGQDAKEAAQNLQRGDLVEAGSSATRGAATIAASIAGSPLLGTIVSGILKTRLGRQLTKGVTVLIIVSLFIPLVLIGVLISALSGTVATVASSVFTSRFACVDTANGGGIPVSDRGKLEVATKIVDKAYELGLGRDAAVLGVMTALAESDLTNGLKDPLQPDDTPLPLQTIGVFQQMPFYWANEFWPSGTEQGSPAFNNPEYFYAAKQAILNVDYAASKFYEKLTTDSRLNGGKWVNMPPWEVAQTIQVSIFSDGSNYLERLGTAQSTVATIIASDPERFTERANTDYLGLDEANADQAALVASPTNPCGANGTYAGFAAYTVPGGSGPFTDGPVIYPNTDIALARAFRYVGNAHLACSDGMCLSKCDHLAGDIWGYEDYSGYDTAKVHWYKAVQTGVARVGDRNPPIGALLFWDTGKSGHVATYVGDGMIVSNWTNGPQGPNVYLIPASDIEEKWGAPYYGWADPIFRGGAPGSALEGKS